VLGKSFAYCPHCNKAYEIPVDDELIEKCMERCLRIKYLKKMSAKFNINLSKYFRTDNLNNLSLEEIDNAYSKFIIELYKFKDRVTAKELFALESLIKNNLDEYSYQQSIENMEH
jgi:hypothetical protein